MASKFKKIIKHNFLWFILIIIVVVVAVIYFVLDFDRPIQLPNEFLIARQNAAVVSGEIVTLTSATSEKIKEVNLSDLSGNANQAHSLIQEARENNAGAYNQAFELSRYLQELVESLNAVPSIKSQRLAYEAVAVELSLVSEFITYTQNLNSFLESLSEAIQTNSFTDRRKTQDYLRDVNERAEKINDLNKEFLVKIEKFDKSL